MLPSVVVGAHESGEAMGIVRAAASCHLENSIVNSHVSTKPTRHLMAVLGVLCAVLSSYLIRMDDLATCYCPIVNPMLSLNPRL